MNGIDAIGSLDVVQSLGDGVGGDKRHPIPGHDGPVEFIGSVLDNDLLGKGVDDIRRELV